MAGRWVRPSVVRWLGGLAASVAAVAAVTGLIGLLDPHVPALSLPVLYILVVLSVAMVWGTRLAVVTSILSVVVFAYQFVPPIHSVRIADLRDLIALGVLLVTAVVVGEQTARSRRMALEAARLSEEQSALRRVATLVAQAGPPPVVFEAVTREVGLLCDADLARMERYEQDGTVTGVAAWSRVPVELEVGTRFALDGPSIARGVQQTGGPVRVDSFGQDTGAIAREARALGIRSSVGCPIVVAGRLWGVIAASTKREEPFPPATEAQIGGFAELVATAIANAQAHEELRALADEQAALRRVATLVARGEPPDVVFAAVAEEVGRLLSPDQTILSRYDPDGMATVVAAWRASGEGVPVGWRYPVTTGSVSRLVRETGRPARSDDHGEDVAAAFAVRSGVGAPITVEGRLWGLVALASTGEQPPPDTEGRLADFTELVATAIANAQAQAELTASRARIVATADQTRRRIERDLHDGAQQRLVSLVLQLRAAQAAIPPGLDELAAELDQVAAGLDGALEELREFARGIHPAILAEGGLGPALRTLARRSSVPVQLQVPTQGRLPEPVEVAAYYVVSEALANAAKHAQAASVTVEVEQADGVLGVSVRDDGVGGADLGRGSGLVGLKDRVEALGGRITLQSKLGKGTSLSVELPLTAGQVPDPG
jgi:signal transduction histidine kinase